MLNSGIIHSWSLFALIYTLEACDTELSAHRRRCHKLHPWLNSNCNDASGRDGSPSSPTTSFPRTLSPANWCSVYFIHPSTTDSLSYISIFLAHKTIHLLPLPTSSRTTERGALAVGPGCLWIPTYPLIPFKAAIPKTTISYSSRTPSALLSVRSRKSSHHHRSIHLQDGFSKTASS